jgi:TPR repeat protein
LPEQFLAPADATLYLGVHGCTPFLFYFRYQGKEFVNLKSTATLVAIMAALGCEVVYGVPFRTPTAAAQQAALYRQQQAEFNAQQQQEELYQRQQLQAEWTYQQQILAEEKNAQLQAEARNVWDAAVKKLTDERDDLDAKLNSEVQTNVEDLKSQEWILKQKFTDLESQRSESDKEAEHERAKQSFMPKNLWRLPNVFARQLREKQEAEKQSITAKAVAFNQSQADKGDAFGLQRMGERYRDGDGVPKDLVKAKDYLSKAVAAGSTDATNELVQLNSN